LLHLFCSKMGRNARKRTPKAIHPFSRKYKTKRKTKDLDQIYEDLHQPEIKAKLENQEVDPDRPGLAQHYCLHCARYFISSSTLIEHFQTKNHKRRVKELGKGRPYTVEDSKLPVDNGKKIGPRPEDNIFAPDTTDSSSSSSSTPAPPPIGVNPLTGMFESSLRFL